MLVSTSPAASARVDKDALGVVEVPSEMLYGAQTARALTNFPLTGVPISQFSDLLIALAQVKKAAAVVNARAGEICNKKAAAISRACDEIIAGGHHHHFCVDICQGGAGTSTNMNANEVIANRALQLLGHSPGEHGVLHPNDHVNLNQSTNDAYATAVRLAIFSLNQQLIEAIDRLGAAMEDRARSFAHVRKLARTQLQDAVEITLGEEFGAFAGTLREDTRRLAEIAMLLLEVNIGGTAVGTGIGASSAYQEQICAALAEVTGLRLIRAENLLEATWDVGAFVLYSGMLKRLASKLSKIASDLRLLSSGPSGGLGEIALPPRQPGSSLMPGKVNPVIPEAMNAIAFRVFGLDLSVTFAADNGQLQLNAFVPVIYWSIHEAVTLLTRGIDMLTVNCVVGIEARPERCERSLERSTALATELVHLVGYARASAIAQRAQISGDLLSAVTELEPQLTETLRRRMGQDTGSPVGLAVR
jgi:aspartate ammonia-lyase